MFLFMMAGNVYINIDSVNIVIQKNNITKNTAK